MPVARSQELKVAIGYKRQSDLATMLGAADLWNLRVGSFGAPVPVLNRTTDAEFFGKGHPHPTQTFKLSKDAAFELAAPFLTSQHFAQAIVFGGGVWVASTNGSGAYQYIGSLITESAAVDMPSTTLLGGIRAGTGGEMLDSALIGMVCAGFTLRVQRGAGLDNATLVTRWVGTGRSNGNTGLTIPSAYVEQRLSAGMLTQFSVNGVSYHNSGRFNDIEFTLENDIDLDGGHGPEAGQQDGYDMRGRMRCRTQRCSLVWTVEAEDLSEFEDFQDGVEGETIILLEGPVIGGGAKHTAKIRLPRMHHRALEPTDANGWYAQRITSEPLLDSSEGMAIFTAITDKASIGASA